MGLFRALVEAQDGRMPVAQSRQAMAERFGVSEQTVRQVEREGLDGNCPPRWGNEYDPLELEQLLEEVAGRCSGPTAGPGPGQGGGRANRIKLPTNCWRPVDFVKGAGLRFPGNDPFTEGPRWPPPPRRSAGTSPAYATPASTAASGTC